MLAGLSETGMLLWSELSARARRILTTFLIIRYCIQIDEESLESILEDEPNAYTLEPFVKFVIGCHPETLSRGFSDWDEQPDIADDKPWVMVDINSVMVGISHALRDPDDWYTVYLAFPDIADY